MNTAIETSAQVGTKPKAPTVLTEHAEAIKALSRRMIVDVVEIGRRLVEVKRVLGHGGFMNWITHEFGWSSSTATRFMQTFQLAAKYTNLTNLPVPLAGIYALAAPSVPKHAVEEVIERASSGEMVSLRDIKALIPRKARASKAQTDGAPELSAGSITDQALNLVMRMSPTERREFAVRLRGLIPTSALAPESLKPEIILKSVNPKPLTIDVQPVETAAKATYTPEEMEARKAALLADVDPRTGMPRFLVRRS